MKNPEGTEPMSIKAQEDAKGKALPVSRCPVCDYRIDAASGAFDRELRPQPGDLSVCMKCGEILIFAENMALREATVADLMDLDKETSAQLLRVQRLIRRERMVK